MAKWYQIARCATATTIAAVAPALTVAEELNYPEGVAAELEVVAAGYEGCCPCPPPVICPPNPCEADGLAMPQGTTPTPAEGDAPAAETPVETPAPEADTAASAPAPAPIDFGPISQPGGGVGFAMASAVAAAPAPGYIDFAPIGTRFRLRYDNAQGSNDPTRGEFLYPTPSAAGGFEDANGPELLGAGLGDVEFEELSLYFEYQVRERLSVFIDAPIRWVGNIDLDGDGEAATESGFSDLRTGFRWGLVDDCDSHVTMQFLISTPTGDAREAVGTGNTSFDIGLLFDQALSDNVFVFGEIRDWFTLDAPTVTSNTGVVDLNANILRLGAGIGVDLIDRSTCCKTKKLTGIFEVVGWTVLEGSSTDINGSNIVVDADGDTIVNGKYGMRYTNGNHTAYVGYGHNWSSDRWYSDLVRFEWGYNF